MPQVTDWQEELTKMQHDLETALNNKDEANAKSRGDPEGNNSLHIGTPQASPLLNLY